MSILQNQLWQNIVCYFWIPWKRLFSTFVFSLADSSTVLILKSSRSCRTGTSVHTQVHVRRGRLQRRQKQQRQCHNEVDSQHRSISHEAFVPTTIDTQYWLWWRLQFFSSIAKVAATIQHDCNNYDFGQWRRHITGYVCCVWIIRSGNVHNVLSCSTKVSACLPIAKLGPRYKGISISGMYSYFFNK